MIIFLFNFVDFRLSQSSFFVSSGCHASAEQKQLRGGGGGGIAVENVAGMVIAVVMPERGNFNQFGVELLRETRRVCIGR